MAKDDKVHDDDDDDDTNNKDSYDDDDDSTESEEDEIRNNVLQTKVRSASVVSILFIFCLFYSVLEHMIILYNLF